MEELPNMLPCVVAELYLLMENQWTIGNKKGLPVSGKAFKIWSWRWDSNPRPADYKTQPYFSTLCKSITCRLRLYQTYLVYILITAPNCFSLVQNWYSGHFDIWQFIKLLKLVNNLLTGLVNTIRQLILSSTIAQP